MFVKRFFEAKLAQASYLIGCPSAREAIVIDPTRDAEQYIAAAAAEGARVTHVTETHIHADFASGSRELAARAGAKLFLSDEGDADWKYVFASADRATLIKDGDHLRVGGVDIEALHTPGHTPEHLSFAITDTVAANEPIAVCTGDFIFVGDVGRPDLLERAANITGTMEAGASALYRSLEKFRARPDWLQIWPGHGAGSSCGKGISAIPHSTLGYEKRFNWAFQVKSAAEFVAAVLAGQPDPPAYFAEMKRLNKTGPRVLGGFTRPAPIDLAAVARLIGEGATVIDTRSAKDFALGFIPGTINIPLNGSFTTWAGWLVPYTDDFFVIVDERTPQAIDTIVRDLAMIGLDRIGGYADGRVIDGWAASGRAPGTIPQITAVDLALALEHGGVTLVDVRHPNEWANARIASARHVPLGHLRRRAGEVPRTKPIVMQCAAGARSAIGASILKSLGFDQVINLEGGIGAWTAAGLPTETAHDK